MFIEFVGHLSDEIKQGLPGWDAQKRMISANRIKVDNEVIAKKNPRQSSVLVWLYPKNGEIFTRLILRPVYKGVHSAQVAFPGGAREDTDTDLWHTALREAQEEVGLPAEEVNFIGGLSPVYIPPSNFWVQPYIGMSEKIFPAVIDTNEVQRAFDINIRVLTDPKIKEEKIIMHSDKVSIKTPYYNIEGYTIWGATAMVLSELEELLRRVDDRMQRK